MQLIPKHGGYRSLLSFRVAQLAYDLTVRFCDRFVSRFSRTHDQMVQAARSGVQNIAEGSQASGTSKKTEIKLTGVARASLAELEADYGDFLRHRQFDLWNYDDARRKELIALRCTDVNQVAQWINSVAKRDQRPLAEVAANAALTLIGVANHLLERQLESLGKAFLEEGGITERMYHMRKNTRTKPPQRDYGRGMDRKMDGTMDKTMDSTMDKSMD